MWLRVGVSASMSPFLEPITNFRGPTALIEIGAWRLPTDPMFDPPGRVTP